MLLELDLQILLRTAVLKCHFPHSFFFVHLITFAFSHVAMPVADYSWSSGFSVLLDSFLASIVIGPFKNLVPFFYHFSRTQDVEDGVDACAWFFILNLSPTMNF